MATKKKCGYCKAETNPSKSLAEQGWIAIQLWVEDNTGKSQPFNKRACPKHREELLKEASKFYMTGGHPTLVE